MAQPLPSSVWYNPVSQGQRLLTTDTTLVSRDDRNKSLRPLRPLQAHPLSLPPPSAYPALPKAHLANPTHWDFSRGFRPQPLLLPLGQRRQNRFLCVYPSPWQHRPWQEGVIRLSAGFCFLPLLRYRYTLVPWDWDRSPPVSEWLVAPAPTPPFRIIGKCRPLCGVSHATWNLAPSPACGPQPRHLPLKSTPKPLLTILLSPPLLFCPQSGAHTLLPLTERMLVCCSLSTDMAAIPALLNESILLGSWCFNKGQLSQQLLLPCFVTSAASVCPARVAPNCPHKVAARMAHIYINSSQVPHQRS